jgi:CheY-like chemotaxis protein
MPSKKARILVAEGNGDSRSAAFWCLRAEGYSVEVAANGFDAAIALDGPDTPDLAIIDLGLPGFGGRNLINQLKSSERFGRIPLIATSLTEPFAPLPDGVVFVRRPFDPEVLLKTVRQLTANDLFNFMAAARARSRSTV